MLGQKDSFLQRSLSIYSTLKMMARPEGFEPPTSWFVAKHSIQLSYGRFQLAELV